MLLTQLVDDPCLMEEKREWERARENQFEIVGDTFVAPLPTLQKIERGNGAIFAK